MPHIEIKCYPGRSEDIKQACADAVAVQVAKSLGCDLSAVSVSIKEVPKENWKDQVFDSQIMADEAALYVKPGYKCE
ncbi:MAG: tautomerase family protein [Saccharofermentans sp.]|nr:tautomerase family protein [Saccharofermentans sp.]